MKLIMMKSIEPDLLRTRSFHTHVSCQSVSHISGNANNGTFFFLHVVGVSVLNVGDRRSRRGTGGKAGALIMLIASCLVNTTYLSTVGDLCTIPRSNWSSPPPRSTHSISISNVVGASSLGEHWTHLGPCGGLCDCVPVSYSYSIEERRGAPAGNSYYYYRYYYVCKAMIVFFFFSCLVPPTSNNNNNQWSSSSFTSTTTYLQLTTLSPHI